jgi:hypothetical protein
MSRIWAVDFDSKFWPSKKIRRTDAHWRHIAHQRQRQCCFSASAFSDKSVNFQGVDGQ